MAYWYQFALLFEALFHPQPPLMPARAWLVTSYRNWGTVYAPLRTINWMRVRSVRACSSWEAGAICWPPAACPRSADVRAANQLLGMLALCVGTTVLIKMASTVSLGHAVPMIFVGVITLSGSYELFVCSLPVLVRPQWRRRSFSIWMPP